MSRRCAGWILALLVVTPGLVHAQDSAYYALTPAERGALGQLAADSGTAFPLINSWHAGVGLQYYTFGREALGAQAVYRVRGGGDVFTSLPGLPGYSSIRLVYEVQLARGMDPAAVQSHRQIEALARAG
ncbi:MAG TPA: hypothetical protein VGI83_02205, partial [Gemmatimonadales bacterium]